MTGRRILLVEDESLIRVIISESLANAGFDVIEAAGGEEALRLLDQFDHLDLLFTDIQMPGKVCGNVVATAGKARHAGLPVIYTTGRPDTLTNALTANDAFIQKPFGTAEILAVVHRLLKSPRPPGAGPYGGSAGPARRQASTAQGYR